jgi:hypothetical protein
MSFCDPWEECVRFGEVVVSRSLYGPPLVVEGDPLPLGALQMHGAALRPYVDLEMVLKWEPHGTCYGPVSSVMSLAPGETVSIVMRERVERSLSESVLEAAVSSGRRPARAATGVIRATRPGYDRAEPGMDLAEQIKQLAGDSGASQAVAGTTTALSAGGVANLAAQQAMIDRQQQAGLEQQKLDTLKKQEANRVEMQPATASKCGSFWRDLAVGAATVFGGPAAGAAVGGTIAAGEAIANEVAGFVEDCVQGSDILQDTGRRVGRMVDSVNRTEKRRSEGTSTTLEREVTVTRTFTNPYRDRSLQLRIVPVFQQYEVGLDVEHVEAGVAMAPGPVATPQAQTRQQSFSQLAYRQPPAPVALLDTPARVAMNEAADAREDGALHFPMSLILDKYASEKENLTAGLDWSGSWVKDESLHVPLAPATVVGDAWALPRAARKRFRDAVGGLEKGVFTPYVPPMPKRMVSIFIGTHVEPVAGECVLADVPEAREHQ